MAGAEGRKEGDRGEEGKVVSETWPQCRLEAGEEEEHRAESVSSLPTAGTEGGSGEGEEMGLNSQCQVWGL